MWLCRTCIVPSILASSLLVLACSGSPTEPPVLDTLSGVWAGSLAPGPNGVDWDAVDLHLTETAGALAGEIRNAAGERWPVSGQEEDTGHARLAVDTDNIPGRCVWLEILVFERERDGRGSIVAISGILQGRCPGTVFREYRLIRRS